MKFIEEVYGEEKNKSMWERVLILKK